MTPSSQPQFIPSDDPWFVGHTTLCLVVAICVLAVARLLFGIPSQTGLYFLFFLSVPPISWLSAYRAPGRHPGITATFGTELKPISTG